MASSWFQRSAPSEGRHYSDLKPPDVEVQVANRDPHQYHFNSTALPQATRSEHSHSQLHVQSASLFDIGIFKDTLAPSLALHSSFAFLSWAAGRQLNRVDAKDWLWPTAQVANGWWSAVGRRVFEGMSLSQALRRLSWPERLILTGVTVWGGRLFYRIASRSVKRGADDPRYEESGIKKEEDFWNKAFFTIFLPEAVFQSIISLPFTAPFRHEGAVLTGYHPSIQMLAVGLFSAGFALETLADYQLDVNEEQKSGGLKRDGVWSIVRHPNYLGDVLVHLSFPLLLFGSDMLAPIELLGPLANYAFLRYFGEDKENETNQEERYKRADPQKEQELMEWRKEKNSFWPQMREFRNKWTWVVIGCGALGVVIEEGVRTFH